jgi:DNA polymerase-3 subunit alpha
MFVLRFTIQDFTGSLQISLYNEKYESYKHLITKGQVLYVEGSNEKGYTQDRYFFNVRDIRMLDTIGKLLTKSLTIKLPLHTINEHLIHELEQICIDKVGPHMLKLKIVDDSEDTGIDLVATQMKISADYQFIESLEQLGLAYRIN